MWIIKSKLVINTERNDYLFIYIGFRTYNILNASIQNRHLILREAIFAHGCGVKYMTINTSRGLYKNLFLYILVKRIIINRLLR